MKKIIIPVLAIIICCIILLIKKCNPPTPVPQNPWSCTSTLDPMAEDGINADSVDFSFVFMGCNRADKSASNVTNPTTANVFQLKRTFNEVCGMKIKPTFFFFLGDVVLGLDTLNNTLENQLTAWVTQFKDVPDTFSTFSKSGITLVAVPGNHEMLTKVDTLVYRKDEIPWAGAPAIWHKVMDTYSVQTKQYGPVSVAPGDGLTYSFNYHNTHFVLVNTDTYYPSHDSVPSLVPANWIVNDITAAHSQSTTQHIFVMGHKPAQIIYKGKLTPQYASQKDDIIQLDSANKIWAAMENNQVEGMLTAHRHEFLVTQPTAGKTTQVIAGNGGSLYENDLPLNNQFFGYTKVYVMKNKQVLVRSFGRLTPGSKTNNSYVAALPCDTLTRLRYSANITWGTQVQWFNPLNSIQK